MSGRVTDVSRRPSRVRRVHSGDSCSQTFSTTQCLEYNRTRWLRHYCCESRELFLFSAFVFGIMCLGSEADFLQFFWSDLEFLSDLKDCFYFVASGAGLIFGGDEVSEMQSCTDSETLLSTCSYVVTSPVGRDKFVKIVMAMADLNHQLYREILPNSNFVTFDLRFEHVMLIAQHNHTVSQFLHRVSGISLMATALRPITDASDPRAFVAMNQNSFAEWPFPYNDLGQLEVLKNKWRSCVCEEPCSSRGVGVSVHIVCQ